MTVTVKVLIDKVVVPLLVKSDSARAKQGLEVARSTSEVLGVLVIGASVILGVSGKYL